MEKIITAVMLAIAAFGLVVGVSMLFAFPVMWAWNYSIPSIFGLREIGFLDAVSLSFLAGTFFKSAHTSSK